MLVLGHRGAPAIALENTLASIDAAFLSGADGIECDLRVTKDGVLVLLHDADLKRVAGRRDRLRGLMWGEARKVALVDGARLATLDDLLDMAESARRRVFLDLELKDGDIEGALAALLRRRVLRRTRVLCTSFDAPQMARLSRIGGPFETGLLDRGRRPHPVLTAQRSGCSWIALSRGSRGALLRARARGLRSLLWTIDEPAQMLEYRSLSVDALCTNAPGLARRVLEA